MKQYIYGKNPIMEALKGASVYKIYMLNGHKDSKIFDICKRNQIPLEFVDKKEFDKKVGKVVHQGVMAYIENYRYYTIDEILKDIPENILKGIDYIKPNETELQILTGMEVKNRKDITEAAKILIKKGVKNVIVTMGGDGCLYINKDIEEFFPAYPVKAIDTTAAGDCFTAAFALALSQNKNWKEAIEFGRKASSIAVTRKGAQTSIPTREEVDEMKGGKM